MPSYWDSQGNVVDGRQEITRGSKTIQTHNAVSVAGTNGTSNSAWIDAQGFDRIAVTVKNDAATSNKVDIYWSNDGLTDQGYIKDVIVSSVTLSSAIVETRARYAKITLINADAASHTMSAWAYLKT